MDNEYYILEAGQKEGPFTKQELMDRPLEPDDLVLQPLQTQGTEAHLLPEFDEYFISEGIYYPKPENTSSYFLRFPAYIIDNIILGFATAIVGFIFFPDVMLAIQKVTMMMLTSDPKLDKTAGLYNTQFLVFKIVVFVATVFYHAICESSRMRASVGKMILGLVVVDALGYSLSFKQALLRNLGKAIYDLLGLIQGLAFFAILIYLRIVWSYRHQGVHDQLSGCFVVKKNR